MRKQNIWIILELFLVFIILWYIVDFFSVMGITNTIPTGTDITNVYRVIHTTKNRDSPKYIYYEWDKNESGRNFLRMLERLREHPEIESVCIGDYPYSLSHINRKYSRDSLMVNCRILTVSPEYFSMFNVTPLDGTDPEVLAKAIRKENSVILSKKAKEDLFKDAPAVGQKIMYDKDSSMINVSGVIGQMKMYEYERPIAHAIFLYNENDLLNNRYGFPDICIKIKHGVSPIGFPERFKNDMKQQLAIGNFFLADIVPLTKQREMYLRVSDITTTLNYSIGISIFFLINIFLGVLGIFWLRIEKRKPEIGIRMSMGSTKVQIMRYMFTESMCLLGIASVPAILVCINMAFMDIMPTENMDFTIIRFLSNTFITYILLIMVIFLSTLYPARRSANIKPAEALHYE